MHWCTTARFGSLLACLISLISVTSALATRRRATFNSDLARKAQKQVKRQDENLDACGTLVQQYQEDGLTQFTAQQAYDCLIIVPFNPAIAREFLAYYRDTLDFQSTLSYLQDPPPGYQQPGVDVLQSLDQIRDNIDTGVYTNEYAFEADLQRVVARTHDGHVSLSAGLMYTFTFGSPVTIVSISPDGIQNPKPYLASKP